jgi:septum formation protein
VPRRLILASRSPRRIEALTALDLEFTIEPSEVEADLPPLVDPTDPVPIAEAKARDIVAHYPDDVILSGDTIVVLGQRALGKPVDRADAIEMLRDLRGREHVVRTGLVVASDRAIRRAEVACPLQMRDYSDAEIEQYVDTGEPMDCAGAYDIHRLGGALVATVSGCFATVVGFPIVQAAMMLREAGIAIPRDPAQMCTALYGRRCLALDRATEAICRSLRQTT